MSGSPWTKEQEDVIRAAAELGLSDQEIYQRVRLIRPNATLQGTRQHRRLILKVYLRRGGPRPHPRPSGPQRHCLQCDKPFRHPHNRICRSCTVKNRTIAA